MSDDVERFYLDQDDSCHWYIIPWSKRQEWETFLDSEGCELGDVPPWAERVNGTHSVSFAYPMVEIEG